MHSAAKLAYADYYQRMIETGGQPTFAVGEEAALLASGCALKRLERLKLVIEHSLWSASPRSADQSSPDW